MLIIPAILAANLTVLFTLLFAEKSSQYDSTKESLKQLKVINESNENGIKFSVIDNVANISAPLLWKIQNEMGTALDMYTKIVYTIVEVTFMLKNITLSADDKLIEDTRKKAMNNNTTLNELFRQWLTGYTKEKNLTNELDQFLVKTSYTASGRSFTRDELNER